MTKIAWLLVSLAFLTGIVTGRFSVWVTSEAGARHDPADQSTAAPKATVPDAPMRDGSLDVKLVRDHSRSKRYFVVGLGMIDPIAALDRLGELPSAEARWARARILTSWIQRNADEACGYIFRHDPSFIATDDFVHAAFFANRLDLVRNAWTHVPDAKERMAFIHKVSAIWPRESSEDYATLLSQVSDPVLRREALNGAMGRWATDDIESTQAFIATHATSAMERDAGYGALVYGLVEQGRIRRALRWIETNADLPDIDSARGAVARGLAGYDPEAALRILSESRPSDRTKEAFHFTIFALERDEPGVAFISYVGLKNRDTPEFRSERTTRLFKNWHDRDPAGALEFVRSAEDIPDPVRESLLRSVQE